MRESSTTTSISLLVLLLAKGYNTVNFSGRPSKFPTGKIGSKECRTSKNRVTVVWWDMTK